MRSKKTKKRSTTRRKTRKKQSMKKKYNIFIICKSKDIFNSHKQTFKKYISKTHKLYHIPAVFLKDTPKNRQLTEKLNTRYNTTMKSKLRKLGCIYAHLHALKKIVRLKSNHNLILEEDATLVHTLPNPPNVSSYLGGWIIPPQITKAGKVPIKISHLKKGLNEINYKKFKVLMAHSYYIESYKSAQEIVKSIETNNKVKNYDVHLIDNEFIHKFYYPAIFVQSKHLSDIDQKTNKNDRYTENYGL